MAPCCPGRRRPAPPRRWRPEKRSWLTLHKNGACPLGCRFARFLFRALGYGPVYPRRRSFLFLVSPSRSSPSALWRDPACRSAQAGARSGGAWGLLLVLSPRTTTTRQSGAPPLGNMQAVHPSRSALRYGVPESVFWLPIPSCDRWRRLLLPLIGLTVFPLGAVEIRFSYSQFTAIGMITCQ